MYRKREGLRRLENDRVTVTAEDNGRLEIQVVACCERYFQQDYSHAWNTATEFGGEAAITRHR